MTYENQINEKWTVTLFPTLKEAEKFIDEYLYEMGLQFKNPILENGMYEVKHTEF